MIDYVAVLPLCSHCDCYLLQYRDDIAGIQEPGMNGTFGGGVETNENHLQAAARELREETNIVFDTGDLEVGLVYHLRNSMAKLTGSEITTVYLLRIDSCDIEVYEGQGLTRIPARGASLVGSNLTPFAYSILNDITGWRGGYYEVKEKDE